MSNEFITGIAQKLSDSFGFTVYTDKIKQGFTQPCFFIQIIESNSRRIISDRFSVGCVLDIHYFSKSNNIKDLLAVADKLLEVLDIISLEDTDIRGTQMSHNIVDNILHFMVSYKTFILRGKRLDEKMHKLEKIKGDIK